MAHVQVEASVTQPERRSSVVTNTFNFVFSFELERDEAGAPIAPKRVLPCNEQQALEVARIVRPGSDASLPYYDAPPLL